MNESELKEQLQGDLEMQGGELNPVGDLRVQEDVHRVLAYDLGPQEQAILPHQQEQSDCNLDVFFLL